MGDLQALSGSLQIWRFLIFSLYVLAFWIVLEILSDGVDDDDDQDGGMMLPVYQHPN